MKISPSLIKSFKSFSKVKTFLEIGRRSHFKPKLKPKFIQKPVHKSQEEKSLHEFLINSLKKCKSIEEQIKVFHSLIKLPVESINCRHSICEELERNLQPYFPSCFVRLIGSSVSGFGTKGCDVDLSIQFNNTNANEQDVASNVILNGESDSEHPDNKMPSSKKQLLTIRKILQNLKYEEPLRVIPGRCPILNFTRHNLSCDLAVNNSVALQSTNLMLLCGRLDERIVPLMQIIHYWAKHLELVGGLDKFKTYAIFLMVVYFLQTRNPPILPSVEIMFEKTGLLKNIGNRSYNITKYVNEFECSKNNQTIEELLKDFFFFYRSFDYSQIICPLSGTCMNRKTFAEKTNPKIEFPFQYNTISIQDPSEETWNVTSCVNWEHSKNFIRAIIAVTEKYQDQNCWIPVPYSWGLAYFIDKDVKEFFMDIPVLSLTKSDFENNTKDFLEQAAKKLEHILRHCLQAQCYHLDENIDFQSLEVPSNVKIFIENLLKNKTNNLIKDNCISSTDCSENYHFPNFETQYVCAISDTWSNRHDYISLFDKTKNIFDNEYEISRKILQDKTAKEKEIFYLLCKCYGVHDKGNIVLRVKVKLIEGSKFHAKLFLSLQKYVLRHMDFE